MKEYNWREEREKFRPNFRQSEPQERQTPLASAKPKIGLWKILLPLVALLTIGIILFTCLRGGLSGGDSAGNLAEVAEKNKTAVGVVTLVVEFRNGQKVILPIGTAWAFAPDKFATNAHVAHGIRKTLFEVKKSAVQALLARMAKEQNLSVEAFRDRLGEAKVIELGKKLAEQVEASIGGVQSSIIVNGQVKRSHPVTHVQIHRDHGVINTSFDPDVAVLTIGGRNDAVFKVAAADTLQNLKSGEAIAFLGFPMENLKNNNLHLDSPVASMQSGIVVAISDFDMKDAGAVGNYLVRHNLPATGGASGSPIFNRKGEVIALLYAGNVIGQVQNSEVTRMPSAAQINFGIRADLLAGVGAPVALQDFLAK